MKNQLAILVVVACVLPLSSGAAECLHYAGEPVTLPGKVTLQTFYGPPDYGENPETDARETQAILVLSKRICGNANPSADEQEEKNQSSITLVPPEEVNLGAYAGRKVTIQGTLFHAQTGHHRTALVMKIIRIIDGRE